jgi:Ca2+/Na+ antiporter
MIHWLSNLIGAVAAIWLISCGLVYMVSPKRGGEMLRRLVVFLAGAFLGLCFLRQFAACIGPLSGIILGLAIVIVAYFIREARALRNTRPAGQQWEAERTPVMPTHIDEEEL